MKTLLLALTAAGLFCNCGGVSGAADTKNGLVKKERIYAISGTVSQTFEYCLGVKPLPGVAEELAIPKPYPGKNFYLRTGSVNEIGKKVTASFTSDQDGHFTFNLPPGIYSIILEEQLKEINVKDFENRNLKADAKCLADWQTKPYYVLEVKDQKIDSLHFDFHHRCFIPSDIPCISYIGPWPH